MRNGDNLPAASGPVRTRCMTKNETHCVKENRGNVHK
jgi:hypothetical protein